MLKLPPTFVTVEKQWQITQTHSIFKHFSEISTFFDQKLLRAGTFVI